MKLMRKNVGLSQKEVGTMIGKSQFYISNIERGHISKVTIEILDKLSKIFHITDYEMLRILKGTKFLNRIEFDKCEVYEQIAYVNKELKIFGSLGRVCIDIGIARSTIRRIFAKSGYIYNAELKQYCKSKI
ncbi:helix-turn-helix transcriptional regulator [Clostridium estertheticum]|nr:helix-turn-helix transcriptional regulator [Clostridium estertheticum]